MKASETIREAAKRLSNMRKILIFTGAGISVESGIPPFRGAGGLWGKYDPALLEIGHFYAHPLASWCEIKRIFYDHWGAAEPNPAHRACAALEYAGRSFLTVTQNIDALHQRAGSRNVVEFHGTLSRLVCVGCGARMPSGAELLAELPPHCPVCGGLLKPDFVFFGEGIPEEASNLAFDGAKRADCVLVIGTSGEVMPACRIPYEAKRHGAFVIEVNPGESAFAANGISDFLVAENAGTALPKILEAMNV